MDHATMGTGGGKQRVPSAARAMGADPTAALARVGVPRALAAQGARAVAVLDEAIAWQRDALGLPGDGPAWRPDASDDTTVAAAYTARAIEAHYARHAPGLTDAGMQVMADVAHFAHRWVRDGQPTFALTHGLAASLLLTDCRGVLGRELAMPFDAALVALPHPEPVLSLLHPVTRRPAAVRWIAVHHWRSPMGCPAEVAALHRADAMSEQGAREGDRRLEREGRRLWEATLPLLRYERATFLRAYAEDGVSLFLSARWPGEDEPVEAWFARGGAVDRELRLGVGDAPSDPAEDAATLAACARLVANLWLYVAGLGPAAPHRARPARPYAGARGPSGRDDGDGVPVPPAATWVLGQGIKLPRELRDAARAFVERRGARAPWRLAARFVRRGHWRNQACGAARAAHRRLWIAPHWVGPASAGVALTRLFDVDARTAAAAAPSGASVRP